jgi:hypothetical protein
MTWARKIFAVPVPRRLHFSTQSLPRTADKLKTISCLFALLLLAPPVLAAHAGGCDEDCKGEYVSDLGECRTDYEKGDENLQDLEECLADTRSEYQDCVDDCTSLGAGGVIACSSRTEELRRVIFLAATP